MDFKVAENRSYMRHLLVSSLVVLSGFGNLGLAATKPVQGCKVTFSVVYLDHLNNTNNGIPKDALNDVQKKMSPTGTC